ITNHSRQNGHARQLYLQNRIRHILRKQRLLGLDKLFPETGNPNLDGGCPSVARTPSRIGKGTASEACPERSRRVLRRNASESILMRVSSPSLKALILRSSKPSPSINESMQNQ